MSRFLSCPQLAQRSHAIIIAFKLAKRDCEIAPTNPTSKNSVVDVQPFGVMAFHPNHSTSFEWQAAFLAEDESSAGP
jgi:hypothetical protein